MTLLRPSCFRAHPLYTAPFPVGAHVLCASSPGVYLKREARSELESVSNINKKTSRMLCRLTYFPRPTHPPRSCRRALRPIAVSALPATYAISINLSFQKNGGSRERRKELCWAKSSAALLTSESARLPKDSDGREIGTPAAHRCHSPCPCPRPLILPQFEPESREAVSDSREDDGAASSSTRGQSF